MRCPWQARMTALAQLVSCQTTPYLNGIFDEQIVAATGCSRSFTYGGFSTGFLSIKNDRLSFGVSCRRASIA
jgi:hypothetical protein